MDNVNMPKETEVSALLNLFMYLEYDEYIGRIENNSVEQILQKMQASMEANGASDSQKNMLHILMEAITPGGSHPELAAMQVSISDVKKYDGISAAVFTNGEDAYVVYKGTGDGKWLDNGQTMTEQMTTSQRQAIRFLDEMAEQYGWNEDTNLTVTGHSKGGNNSQAAALGSENGWLVDRCISFDGQGMSDAGEDYYRALLQDNYEERVSRMYSVCGKNDPVNELGNTIIAKEHTFYIETHTGENDLVSTHALEYLFYDGSDYRCIMNETTQQGPIGEYAGRLNQVLMDMPPQLRADCAVSLMQIIEIVNGGSWIGYDGTHAASEEIEAFRRIGIPAILYSIAGTEEGRTAMASILEDLIAVSLEANGKGKTIALIWGTIAMLPVIVIIGEGLMDVIEVFSAVMDIMDRLKLLTSELQEFFDQCWNAVIEFGEKISSWIREHFGERIVILEADFLVDSEDLMQAEQQIEQVYRKFRQAAERMDQIRSSIPVYGASGWALRLQIDYLEWQVQDKGNKAMKMAGAAGNCGKKYRNYENRIVDNAAAIA